MNCSISHASVSLRVPAHMFKGIKNTPNKRDVPYLSLIKVWLRKTWVGRELKNVELDVERFC